MAESGQFDPQNLLSLYGMTGMYGGGYGFGGGAAPTPPSTLPSSTSSPPTSTLGVAASQAQSLGLNPASAAWWNMASQLAAQEYISRFQAAARDTSTQEYMSRLQAAKEPAAATDYLSRLAAASREKEAAAQEASQEYLSRLQAAVRDPAAYAALQSQGLLPSYELLTQGSKGRKERGARSSTEAPTGLGNIRLPQDTEILKGKKRSAGSPMLSLPTGLTIEKKKPGRKPMDPNYHMRSSGEMVDRVEITRIPRTGALDMRRGTEKARVDDRQDGGSGETPLNLSMKSEKSNNSDYFPEESMGGAFLAEQIRQQQLATQLHKHLQPGSLTAMQALLSLGRLQQADQDARSLQGDSTDQDDAQSLDGKSRNLGRGSLTVKPKKNTVASLLAHSRGTEIPELTIEPIFKRSVGQGGFDFSTLVRTHQQNNRLSSERESEGHLSDVESLQDSNGLNSSARQRGRQVVTDTEELKVPLRYGWKRETTIREFSKSGIRGEVVYVAPCGKRFKQYPDIIRYIEKRGMSQHVKRTHFSFSTKLIVGDFLKPTGTLDQDGAEKYERYTDDEMNDEIDRMRRENGWKPRKRGKSQQGRKSLGVEAEGEGDSLASFKEEEDRRARVEKEQSLLQKEAVRILKEAERREKAELLRREKERVIEEKRRKQDELNRQRQEEKMKKLQELELKRQQCALIKEQEKERRREHMVLIKQFDTRKRNEERKKKIEELKVEKERERERRLETRRLELEILSEMKRPVEDMSVQDTKPLPEIPRIPGMKLAGDAFANLLMVFEFIHNFGETLGFDMDSLPSMGSLQAGILNEEVDSEEELLSVLTHLVVCAIEDPGVPNPLKQLTVLGQNLRQADVTHTNITEILRIFVRARAQYEIRLFHGVSPPETKDKKEAMQGPFVNADASYLGLLEINRTWQMSEWVKDKPFLALNPRQKTDILAFLCNELLNNKAVVNQIEGSMENLHVTRRKKLSLDNKVRKLKILHNRKYKCKVEVGRYDKMEAIKYDDSTNASGFFVAESENHSEVGDDKDDSMSVLSESTRLEGAGTDTPKTSKGARGRKKKGGKGKKKEEEEEAVASEEEGSDMDASEEDEAKEDEEDRQLSAEDLQKKIEKVVRLARKRGEDLGFLNNSLRASDLGQDRYRRRYWHLAHCGGIYLEGIESAEPWKLELRGLNSTTTFSSVSALSPPPAKRPKLEAELKVEGREEANKENHQTSTPNRTFNSAYFNLGDDVSITPKSRKVENRYSPKVTPNGERLNLFNHSAYFNMSLSPLILNGAVTITPRESPATFGIAHVDKNSDRPWFNLVSGSGENEFHPGRSRGGGDTLPHINMLETKLEVLRKMNTEGERKPIPLDKCYGWWLLGPDSLVAQLETCLLLRGAREQQLLSSLKRGVEGVQECKGKVDPTEMSLVQPTDRPQIKVEEVVPGAPRGDLRGTWSREVALRVEKYILEQIESLEDKVASASMQVPGWKIPDRLLADTLKFRPSCQPGNDAADGLNVVEVSRQRLQELEAAIERRYLKAPLGGRTASLHCIAASTERNKNDDTMEVDEKEAEECPEENKENKDDTNEPVKKEAEDPEDGDADKKAVSEGIPRGLQTWREAVQNSKSAAQLAMAFYILESSIAWDKSIMKASCQFCHGEEDENALLLCDSCDRGYHTYCFKPAITTIPEGDWYCFECVNKATGLRHCLVCGGEAEEGLILCNTCPRAYHQTCITPPLAKILCPNGSMKKTPRGKWHCPGCSLKNPKKTTKKARSLRNTEDEWVRKEEDASTPTEEVAEEEKAETTKPPKKKSLRLPKVDKDMSICQTLLSELGGHDESWPFINPVNTKQFPTYKKIIKNPMDISTIKKKLNDGVYKAREEFREDVNLIFSNCKRYNEDESPVGRAGHLMKLFFDSRWAELISG